jgi:hypothetical protein
MWYEVVRHGECRRGRKIDRHAKDVSVFASEAKVRKNRKEAAYYNPSNEDPEALHGLIGLKNSILGRGRSKR